MQRTLHLGTKRSLDGKKALGELRLPPHHLLTHAVIVGMTGSGKTGLVIVMIEEALRAGIPVLVFDIKGDMANLLLALRDFDHATMAQWVEAAAGDEDGLPDEAVVAAAVAARKKGLAEHGIFEADIEDYVRKTHIRVITPGSDAGESLHLLSALERRSTRWDTDVPGARAALSAAISFVLRLIGRVGDPGRSKEHAFLSVLAEERLLRGESAALETLLPLILEPPMTVVGALPVDAFLSPKRRADLAADLNTLLASPSFLLWRQGQSVDVAAWMESVGGKTPVTIVSVAHLDDDERGLVLGVILEEVLTWVRTLPGSSQLRGLVFFDEVYGYLPPHPAKPPTKKPLVSLMKQARAFGVGCVLATQNPMDLDYRALSNAALWFLSRLPTDMDRERLLEGLGENKKKSELGAIVKKLEQRWFLMKGIKTDDVFLLFPRWAISYLRGPMTPSEIKRAAGTE